MDKVDKYITEEFITTSKKRAEIKIVLAIPENMGKTEITKWVKSKFSNVIKQGDVIDYNIKIK